MSDIKLFRAIVSNKDVVVKSKVDENLYLIKSNTDYDDGYKSGYLRETIISRFINIGDNNSLFQMYYDMDSTISYRRSDSDSPSWEFIVFDNSINLEEYTDLELIIKFGRKILDKDILGDLHPIIEGIEI